VADPPVEPDVRSAGPTHVFPAESSVPRRLLRPIVPGARAHKLAQP